MKSLLITLVSTLFLLQAKAQVPMAAYVEVGGPGLISINYDTRFSQAEDGLGGRIGVGGLWAKGEESDRVSIFTLPVGLNYLFGKDGKNYFEVGAGFTYLNVGSRLESETSTFSGSFGNLTFGYRLAPENGGFLFKAQLTPIFGQGGFFPFFGGIGLGYKF